MSSPGHVVLFGQGETEDGEDGGGGGGGEAAPREVVEPVTKQKLGQNKKGNNAV